MKKFIATLMLATLAVGSFSFPRTNLRQRICTESAHASLHDSGSRYHAKWHAYCDTVSV